MLGYDITSKFPELYLNSGMSLNTRHSQIQKCQHPFSFPLAAAMDDSWEMTTKGDTIRADLETTRVLLRQALEQFDQLESKVSKLKLV